MKLNNGEILNSKEPLEELIRQKFPVRTALALLKLARKIDEVLIPAQEVRNGLIRTYGSPNKDNPALIEVRPDSEGFAKYCEEFGELLSEEVELVLKPVAIPDTVEVSPATMVALEKFITVAP